MAKLPMDTITHYEHDGKGNINITITDLIRCKDCEHYYDADNRIPLEQRYTCALDGDRWKPEDFCSYAERKDNG